MIPGVSDCFDGSTELHSQGHRIAEALGKVKRR